MYERIPIPNDRATRREPIRLEVPTLDAFPGQTFHLTLVWNSALQRWIFQARTDQEGQLFHNAPAQLYRPYTYDDVIGFMFINPSGRETKISPRNLGDQVQLVVQPGPEAPELDTYEERIRGGG